MRKVEAQFVSSGPIDQAASGPIERRPDPQLVRLGAEIVPHLVHLDDDGALGDRFETACLDVFGHPADHRVGAGRQQPADTPQRQPVSVESNGGPLRLVAGFSGRIHSCELIPAAPAQPSVLAVMVTGIDNTDTMTTRAISWLQDT